MPSFLRIVALAFLVPLAAHASLVISPAAPLADPAERVGAYRPQHEASIAWNGERGLVAWRARVGQRDFLLVNHVDATGKPLEAAPIVVFKEGQALFTRVVALGSRFLVIWNYYDETTAATRAALISPEGAIQHLGRIGPVPFMATDLASNGTTAVIAGSTGSPDYHAVLVWVDEQGQMFASRTFGASLMLSTRVVSDGTSFFAITHRLECGVYTCGHTFSLIRANADGTAEQPRVIRTVGEAQSFDYVVTGVAVTRDRLLVVFQEPRGLLGAMLFDHDGNTVAGPFSVEDSGASGAPVTVESDGSSFVVAYPHAVFHGNDGPPDRSTRLRRIGAGGASEPAVLTNQQRIVALEWTGSGYLLASTTEYPGISVTRLPPSGAPIAGTPEYVLSHAPNQQETVDSLWDGAQLFTAWEEFFPLEGLWKVKYGRNDASGNALDGRGRAIGASQTSQRNPRIVFDGTRYLVLWTETIHRTTTIHARRVHRDGLPAGEAFIVAPTFCMSDFDAARVGNRVLVAHQAAGCDQFSTPRSVLITPVESNDMVSSSNVVAERVTFLPPVIESAGTSALLVWVESIVRTPSEPCPYPFEYCPPKQVLRGAVISDGTTKRVAIADDDRMVNREPQVAWNGSNYLVAWAGGRDINTIQSLYTRAFAIDGNAMSSANLLAAEASYNYGPERRGSVIATASGFLVAWQRWSWLSAVSVWRVAANGSPIDTTERAIEVDVPSLRAPVLTQGPGRSYLVYSVSGPDELYLGHNRIVWRSLSEIPRTRAVRR
jgi:hypothetical protein